MKTILIQAIDPDDGIVRGNEILVSRIVGWYTRGRYCAGHNGPTTIVSIDSGVEYEIAETPRSLSKRFREIADPPVLGWIGTISTEPALPPNRYCAYCGHVQVSQ